MAGASLRKQNRIRRRHVSFAELARKIGKHARAAFRHARVGVWRFKRSPELRDRAAAFASFAFIGLFAIASVDAVVTGGADFDPGTAYAMDYPAAHVITPAPAPAVTAEPETPAETAKTVAEEIDYSFTTEDLLGGPEETTVIDEGSSMTLGGKAEASAPVADVNPKDAVL